MLGPTQGLGAFGVVAEDFAEVGRASESGAFSAHGEVVEVERTGVRCLLVGVDVEVEGTVFDALKEKLFHPNDARLRRVDSEILVVNAGGLKVGHVTQRETRAVAEHEVGRGSAATANETGRAVQRRPSLDANEIGRVRQRLGQGESRCEGEQEQARKEAEHRCRGVGRSGRMGAYGRKITHPNLSPARCAPAATTSARVPTGSPWTSPSPRSARSRVRALVTLFSQELLELLPQRDVLEHDAHAALRHRKCLHGEVAPFNALVAFVLERPEVD